jgi:diguanylate cyclase (GGDEF)-like protein
VPVEILAVVLVVSVLVNGALLWWLSRSEQVNLRWPFGGAADRAPEAADPPVREAAPRRRAIFIAGEGGEGSRGQIPVTGGGSATSSPLPSDLADLLNRPAALGGRGDARVMSSRESVGGFHPASPDGTIVRMQPAIGSASRGGIALDALTSLEDQQSWSRIIEVENARLLRYRRPSTIVMAEVDGLRKLAERMGEEPVERLLPVVADAFRNEARASDWIARIGYSRFAVFLAETDEIAAINYVERIRQLCEPWLASAAVPLRLAIGWSSPNAASDLEYAIKRAEERMHADRRMPVKLPGPRGLTPRVVALPGADSAGDTDAGQGEEGDDTIVSPAEPGSIEPEDLSDLARAPRALG